MSNRQLKKFGFCMHGAYAVKTCASYSTIILSLVSVPVLAQVPNYNYSNQNWSQGGMQSSSNAFSQNQSSYPINQPAYNPVNQSGYPINQPAYNPVNQSVYPINQPAYNPVNQSVYPINQPGYNGGNQLGYMAPSQPSYNAVNTSLQPIQPAQSFPRLPYTAQFISEAGQRTAERLRSRAQQMRMFDPYLEANIKAAILSGGAAGIDQGPHGDCWFEAALAAVARLPAGQQLIASMIIENSPGSYLVRFRGVQEPMPVSAQETVEQKTRDMSSWASIIEVAALKGWPDLAKEDSPTPVGPNYNQPRIILGLRSLTGQPVECIDTTKVPPWMIGQMLTKVLHTQAPMTAATYSEKFKPFLTHYVVPKHAYTVMEYDPANDRITLRNPWGRNSTPMNKSKYPDLPQIGQEAGGVYDFGGGVIQMPMSVFVQHYHYLAWSTLQN